MPFSLVLGNGGSCVPQTDSRFVATAGTIAKRVCRDRQPFLVATHSAAQPGTDESRGLVQAHEAVSVEPGNRFARA